MDKLCDRLRSIFADDRVNIDEVMCALNEYKSDRRDWQSFALFDEHKYTRNLVDIGNGKYNLMILCWGPGQGSSIHDHTNSHCFVKVLDGQLLETRYAWPTSCITNNNKDETIEPLTETDRKTFTIDGVTYMSDELGLHRMENPSNSESAITLHLYVPAYDHCYMFDQRTGHKCPCQVTFYSEYGKKVDICQKMNEQRAKKKEKPAPVVV